MTREGLWNDPDFCSELIPSSTVWEHLGDWRPTDFELAAIVSHMQIPLQKREEYLLVIGQETDDQELRLQIRDVIQNRERGFEQISEGSPTRIFVLKTEEDGEEAVRGYFGDFNMAKEVGRQLHKPFLIEKHPLDRQKGQPVGAFNPFWDPKAPAEELLVYDKPGDAHPIGLIRYNESGEEMDWWLAPGSNAAVPPIRAAQQYYDPALFLNAYVELPNPFERGDIVTILDRAGQPTRYGIVVTSQQEWQEFNHRVRHQKGTDYSDASILVDFFERSGYFSHGHIDPRYLMRDLPDNKLMQACLLVGRSLMLGEGTLDEFCSIQRAYQNQYFRSRGLPTDLGLAKEVSRYSFDLE